MSRDATQLAMGPWYVRDEDRPFMPGFSADILRQQVKAGRVKADTIVRGPTTHQFWVRADRAPGLSRLLGKCHSCASSVSPSDHTCSACKADQSLPEEIDRLGLSFVAPAERTEAQKKINASRAAAASKPKPIKSKKAAPIDPGKPLVVDPSMMKPIEPEPTQAESHEHGHEDDHDHDAVAEDLWHAAASAPSRRRKRKSGPDPLVIGMGALLVCVVTVGMFLIITSDGRDDDGQDDFTNTPPTPEVVAKTPTEVAAVSLPVLSEYEQLKEQGVPQPFETRLVVITRLLDKAELAKKTDQQNAAYDHYTDAQEKLVALMQEIAQWELDQLALSEMTELRERVESIRKQAEAAQAQRWASAAWGNAQDAYNRATPMIASGQYEQAGEVLGEAEAMYQMSLGRAQSAQLADEARKVFSAAMQAGFSQQTLRKEVPALLDEVIAKKSEAERLLAEGSFGNAEEAFVDALDALNQAGKTVELKRYAKVYAYDAGFRAAGVLLLVAAGDGIEADRRNQLVEAFDKLGLPRNPAAALNTGQDADYGDVANALIINARDSIKSERGETARASYQAGFHARIIDQTLNTLSLSDDQQKRIHQSLGVLEEQAQLAGWDATKLRPAIELVRTANRSEKIKTDPTRTRQAWLKLLTPLQSRESALQIIDPSTSTAEPTDPELFPNVGS